MTSQAPITVADLLRSALGGHAIVLGCFMSQMELLYRVWKDEGEQARRLAYVQCLALPIEWVHESRALLITAAEVKATDPLSLADAWIIAAAMRESARLVHKAPEMPGVTEDQLVLPMKGR